MASIEETVERLHGEIAEIVAAEVEQKTAEVKAQADAKIQEAEAAALKLNDSYKALQENSNGDVTSKSNELQRRTEDLDRREAVLKPSEQKVADMKAKLVEKARELAALRDKYNKGVEENAKKAEGLKLVEASLKEREAKLASS